MQAGEALLLFLMQSRGCTGVGLQRLINVSLSLHGASVLILQVGYRVQGYLAHKKTYPPRTLP